MLFNNYDELEAFIKKNANAEKRNCEFKSSNKWDGEFKYKIVRSILCISNVQDGGSIIIGVDENKSQGTFTINPLSKSDAETYKHDEIMKFVNTKYADPSVNLVMQRLEKNGKELVNIHVPEFDSQPVICKGDYQDILKKGRIYSRSYTNPECTPNLTGEELREIIELAKTKAVVKEIQRLQSFGMIPKHGVMQQSKPLPTNEEWYKEEAKEFDD